MLKTAVGFVGVVCLLSACSSPPDEQVGDDGAEQALTSSGSCDRGKTQQGASGDRLTILQRGFTWLDAHVPYNQGSQYQGYRTDCSGFVSMAWQLGKSETTS